MPDVQVRFLFNSAVFVCQAIRTIYTEIMCNTQALSESLLFHTVGFGAVVNEQQLCSLPSGQ